LSGLTGVFTDGYGLGRLTPWDEAIEVSGVERMLGQLSC
jgi:hypothetical protein